MSFDQLRSTMESMEEGPATTLVCAYGTQPSATEAALQFSASSSGEKSWSTTTSGSARCSHWFISIHGYQYSMKNKEQLIREQVVEKCSFLVVRQGGHQILHITTNTLSPL